MQVLRKTIPAGVAKGSRTPRLGHSSAHVGNHKKAARQLTEGKLGQAGHQSKKKLSNKT